MALRGPEDWDLWIRIAARHEVLVDRMIVVNHYLSEDGISRKDPYFLLGHYKETYERLFSGLLKDPKVSRILCEHRVRVDFNLQCMHARQQAALYPSEGRKSLLKLAVRHPLWVNWPGTLAALLMSRKMEEYVRGFASRCW